MTGDGIASIVAVLVTGAAWASLWYKMGGVEKTSNLAMKEWQSLKNLCPLCKHNPGEKEDGP